MAEKRLIDANELTDRLNHTTMVAYPNLFPGLFAAVEVVDDSPTVDAVEVPDKDLLKAIKLLIKQYEHSKQSDYVHSPVAHALYRTWKQMDERREGECKIYLHPQKYTC